MTKRMYQGVFLSCAIRNSDGTDVARQLLLNDSFAVALITLRDVHRRAVSTRNIVDIRGNWWMHTEGSCRLSRVWFIYTPENGMPADEVRRWLERFEHLDGSGLPWPGDRNRIGAMTCEPSRLIWNRFLRSLQS